MLLTAVYFWPVFRLSTVHFQPQSPPPDFSSYLPPVFTVDLEVMRITNFLSRVHLHVSYYLIIVVTNNERSALSNLNVARSLKRQIQEREISITFQIEYKFPPFPFFCTTCFDLKDPPFQPFLTAFSVHVALLLFQ